MDEIATHLVTLNIFLFLEIIIFKKNIYHLNYASSP